MHAEACKSRQRSLTHLARRQCLANKMYFVLAARRLRELLGDARVRVGLFRCGVPRGQPGYCERELNMPECLPRTFRARTLP